MKKQFEAQVKPRWLPILPEFCEEVLMCPGRRSKSTCMRCVTIMVLAIDKVLDTCYLGVADTILTMVACHRVSDGSV